MEQADKSKQQSTPMIPKNKWISTSNFVVTAKNNKDNAVETKIHLEEGEVIILEPNHDDRWGAHTSDGPLTNYQGHGRTDSLMAMFFRVGETVAPVTVRKTSCGNISR